MRRRLRKKLHLAEFQVLGFYVTGELRTPLAEGGEWALWDAWIDFIESRGLVCGGSWSSNEPSYRLFVERAPRSCTKTDRDAVEAWLRARSEIGTVTLHDFEDVYYPEWSPLDA